MNKVPNIIKALLYPPKHVLFIISPAVFAALIYTFAARIDKNVPTYIIYGMSAYCLFAVLTRQPHFLKL